MHQNNRQIFPNDGPSSTRQSIRLLGSKKLEDLYINKVSVNNEPIINTKFRPHFSSTPVYQTDSKPQPPYTPTIIESTSNEVKIEEDDIPKHSDRSTLICNDDNRDYINITATKFSKPRNPIQNNFKPDREPSILDTLKEICNMCDTKEYTPEMLSYMEQELQMSTQMGTDKFRKRTQKQIEKINAEKDVLENSASIPKDPVKMNTVKQDGSFKKGALRLAKVKIFEKPYMCMIDSGAQSSLVNTAVLNSLNVTSKAANIHMSTCGSTLSNNIKGLINLNLQFDTLADKTLSWTSTFLEATNTNNYPLIIGADIILGQHDTILTSSKWIFDKLENDEVHEIKLEEEIEDTNLATLICHSTQNIEPNAKCIVEY